MKTKEIPANKMSFPWRLYFQQLFAADIYVKFINPFSFWRRYKINHLETCREFDTVRYLEGCHQLECPSKKLQERKHIKNLSKTATDKSVIGENIPQNKILISQPSFELKYRGVTYRTTRIVAVSATQITIKSGLLSLDSAEQLSTSNNKNHSETSSNISQSRLSEK